MATSEDIPQCGKWQPIESAPKDGTWIIGANGKTPTRPIQFKDAADQIITYVLRKARALATTEGQPDA